MNIQEFLGRRNVSFNSLPHRETFDAQRMAQAVHESGHHVAKTVLLRVGMPPEYIVAVLPATHDLDFNKVGLALGKMRIELATETEMGQRCPDCELGVLPPFGSQYNMRTLVDDLLSYEDEIVFESNVHTESIRMRFADFVRIESPLIAPISI